MLDLGPEGRAGWTEARDARGFSHYRTEIANEQGTPLRLAAAWLGGMGERAAAARATELVEALNPGCLAMCGICAGDPSAVALGDVIVADRFSSKPSQITRTTPKTTHSAPLPAGSPQHFSSSFCGGTSERIGESSARRRGSSRFLREAPADGLATRAESSPAR